MTETVSPSPPDPAPSTARSGCWRWFISVALLMLLVLGLMGLFFLSTLKDIMTWAGDLPGRLTETSLETRFTESITRIVSTNGDILEVATLETNETVSRYDTKTLFNQFVYLGTTVSEIRTPVVYRYHIKLSDRWQLVVQDGQCIVHAPGLRPSLPPAVRTEGIEKKSEAGWFRFNAGDNLATLEKELTPTLEKRAGNKSHLDTIREAARKSVAEFVKKWLLNSARNSDGSSQVRSITVIFPDDEQLPNTPITLPPTVQMQ